MVQGSNADGTWLFAKLAEVAEDIPCESYTISSRVETIDWFGFLTISGAEAMRMVKVLPEGCCDEGTEPYIGEPKGISRDNDKGDDQRLGRKRSGRMDSSH
jgi:hypothetical protein